MSKNKSANEHKANQGNANKGTSGNNSENAKVHGNRGQQLNTDKPKK